MTNYPDKDLDAAFTSAFSADYFKTRIRYYKTPIATTPNKFEKPEQFFYDNKRYQECITYIQSLQNFYHNYYINYLIKANIKMGNYNSGRTVTTLYASSKTPKEEKDKTMRYFNDVIKNTHIDEFYIAEKLLYSNFRLNPSYKHGGDSMIAKRNIAVGETILIEEPLYSAGNRKCAHCFHDSAVSKCCVTCKSVYYCSEDCRSNNETSHQGLCNLYTHQMSPYARMAFYLICKMMPTREDLFENQITFNNIYKEQPMYKTAIKDLLNTSCELLAYAQAESNCGQLKGHGKFARMFLKDIYDIKCSYTELGAVMLTILFFCKYKSVLIFDNVLGTSNEFYLALSMFPFSCQPNTVISCTGNKIVLKASRDIIKGEEVCCSYFDLFGNTTFLDVLLNNEVAMSTLRENCELVCKCKKSPYNCLSTHTNNIDADCEFKHVPAEFKCLLQMIISNTRQYLKSRDPELLYSTFNMANEVILNKNHLLLQGIYFEVIKQEISLKNFGDAHQHLPIIMNRNHIQFFKRSHAEICSGLLHHTKAVFGEEKMPLSLLEVLRNYWKFIEKDVCPCYPNEMLMDIVKTMKPYIFTEDLENEVFPMKASEA